MKKVLIIESSKFICTFLSRRIKELLDIEVDIAHSFEDAKEMLWNYDEYFMVLVDSDLADTDSLMAVEFLEDLNVATMVLASKISDDINKTFENYSNIVDIALKSSPESLNYIASLVSRLYHNRSVKVLIVDDSQVAQKQLLHYLRNQLFITFIANDPIEGLQVLENNGDIKIIISDYNMPNLSGVEFMKIIRRTYSKDKMSVIGISSDTESSIEFLKNGANDFIQKPFTKEEFICRINNSAEALENIQKIEEMANIDFLTNISNRKYFFQKAEKYHKKMQLEGKSCAVAMIDIDNFKLVNDTYGHGVGDDVIKRLANILSDNVKGQDIVARFGGEEFVIFLQDITPEASSKFLSTICKKVADSCIKVSEDKEINFTISIGVATDKYDNLDDKINKADELLYVAKANGKNRVVDDVTLEVITA